MSVNEGLCGLCIVGAIVVMCTGHDGWGWLLLIALLVH